MVQRSYNAFAVRVVGKEGEKRQVLPFHDTSEGQACVEMRIRLYPDGAMSNLLKQLIKVCVCARARVCVQSVSLCCQACVYLLSLCLCVCTWVRECLFRISCARCDCVACNRTRPTLAFAWQMRMQA